MNAAFVTLSRNRALLRLMLASMLTLMLLCLSVTLTRPANAAPSGITYLGQLLVGGVPANGSYDFQFQLFNAATGGSQVGPTVSLTSVPVAQGLYFASLYFGTNIFTGQTLWLQISYRVHPSSGNPAYTTQSPRNVAPNSAFADYAQLSGSTAALQSYPISTTAPSTGQVLQWNGSLWTPTTPSGGGGGSYTAGTGLSLSGTTFSVATGGITNSLLANGSVSGAKLALPLTASVSSSSDLFTLSNTGSGRAIVGNSTSNTAVKGVGYNGVYGQGTNYGVQASGTNYGVYATSGKTGVYGKNTGSSNGDYGLLGGTEPVSGQNFPVGVYGNDNSEFGYGVFGTSHTGYGVYGYCDAYGNGVFGNSVHGDGVSGNSSDGSGVHGNSNSYIGVYGYSSSDIGVYGSSGTGGYAGYFGGNVTVTGNLSKAGGSFKIDDPIDPANKYLYHSFVESPDMMNIYNGEITLDANGAATVTMPKWFQALNQEFRYQLTAIGAPGPNLYIAQKVKANRFQIAGGQPGAEVSWTVTGIRHDAWANAHRIPVEENKPADEQGLYLHPKELGLPESQGINFGRDQAMTQNTPKPPTVGGQQ